MKKILVFLFSWLLSHWLLTDYAYAKNYEAKSENFVLVGSLSEYDAKTLLQNLEAYRSEIFSLLKSQPGVEKPTVRIYVAKSTETIEKITGSTSSLGVYRLTREGPVFILSSKKGFKKDNRAAKIAFHEYTHHMMSKLKSTTYPRWFDEGFAEYLATFKIRKNDFTIGVPDEDHSYILSSRTWFPMDSLIGSVHRYPFINAPGQKTQFSRALFYAQSWLAVHYIQSNPSYGKKFNNYVARINNGESSISAFKAAFGMSPDEFGDVLRAYYKANRYKKVKFKMTKKPSDYQIEITELSDADITMHFEEAKKAFKR